MGSSRRWEDIRFGFGRWGFGGWGGRGSRRRRQWFDAGDMKYVILRLLQDKPRHGYEVMKELEEQLHGCYTPSPGAVYPTLQWLEDEGLVRSREIDGKKVYEVTDIGRQFLEEHRDTIDEIFERVRDAVERAVGGAMGDVNRAVGHLVKQVYRAAWAAPEDAARRRIVEVLERAASDVQELMPQRPSSS